MKKLLLSSACLLGVAVLPALAGPTIYWPNSGTGEVPTGVNYLTFDTLTPGWTGTTVVNTIAGSADNVGVTLEIKPDGKAVQGSQSGVYAAPVLSGGQGAPFGGQADGVDVTTYLTTGKSPVPGGEVILRFATPQQYLGLLWGSVDLYNTLEFFDANGSIGSITGGQVNAAADGNQGAAGTYYININSDVPFTYVKATSSQYAFEFDNVAFNSTPVTIPDGGALTGILGASLLGLGAVSRKLRVG